MKVLVINSRYFLSAGPEKYMFGLQKLLEDAGHEFIPFSVKNSANEKTEFEGMFAEPIGGGDKVYYNEYRKTPKTVYQILERQFYSFHVRKRLKDLIRETKPDIAYILHHFNKLSPSVIDACKSEGLPVVLRISDFFLVCPEAHMYRDGPCEECIHHSLWRCVRYKCIKGSRMGSLVKASSTLLHRKLGIYQKVDRVIVPSSFTMEKLTYVLPRERMLNLPTFVLTTEKLNRKLGKYLLFVGRIEENKGVMLAIQAVEGTKHQLKIVGKSSTGYDKVLKDYIKKKKINNVELLGAKFKDDLAKLYRECRAVILPSLWYENMPNVALEAKIFSRPLIATRLGSLPDLVNHGKSGFLFAPYIEELKGYITQIFEDDDLCRSMCEESYNEAKTTYSPDHHFHMLMEVFKSLR